VFSYNEAHFNGKKYEISTRRIGRSGKVDNYSVAIFDGENLISEIETVTPDELVTAIQMTPRDYIQEEN